MSDKPFEHEDEYKSGATVNPNARMRGPHFDEGDDVQMVVHKGGYDDAKRFTIRAMRQEKSGYWKYQLCKKQSGEKYKGDRWFPERELKDA